jgi:hypothetical protein
MGEIEIVTNSLKSLFSSASDIYVDVKSRECELKVSVDDFRGEISGRLFENGISFEMVDFWDNFPYKYIFQYHPLNGSF